MKKLVFLFFLVVSTQLVFSQHSSLAYNRLADSLYQHHNYQYAAKYYQKALKKAQQKQNIMLAIARCYSKMKKINEADLWFEKAKTNNAIFSTEDVYEYTQVLITLHKRKEAEQIIQDLLKREPHALLAKQLLDDLQNHSKYYKDSSVYRITSLNINTPQSEFAPVFYKDGIVFSSAPPQHFIKKKYHWDHSQFLNLYYSVKITDVNFQAPVIFNKELNTRYHDGPISFYAKGEKMIVNRNQMFKISGKKHAWIWHLGLYDVQRTKDNKEWESETLPFDEPPYSFAHPAVSEDGNVLYFISDKPGGYGGTDLYRVNRINGIWRKPFNLGPSVNTSENEVFPFIINNTLYFASNGHGGLGGLDIFKSIETVNGFSPPINMGHPINSTADDFSFITKDDQQTGYFSSSRNGNDDLFSFAKQLKNINMLALIYDGETNEPLDNASIQLLTANGNDLQLHSDSLGVIHYDLPPETIYVIIGSKDNKIGMASGYTQTQEDLLHLTHQIPAYRDTINIACTGFINDEYGVPQPATNITILDKTSGKPLPHEQDQSVIIFFGEKGHTYNVEIKNKKGEITTHELAIAPNESEAKAWTMILKTLPASMNMAARVFDSNNLPVKDAQVKVITYGDYDQELTSDTTGLVEFTLPEGTAYVLIGNKDNQTGMHFGTAQPDTDKATVIHPVHLQGNIQKQKPVAILITDSKGILLNDFKAVIIAASTGEKIPAEIKDGMLLFVGDEASTYTVEVEHHDYEPASEQITIPQQPTDLDKFSISLNKKTSIVPEEPQNQLMAGLIKNKQGTLLYDANVLVSDKNSGEKIPAQFKNGILSFEGLKGKTYTVTVDHQDYLPTDQDITIPKNSPPEKISITLEEKEKKVAENYLMAVQVIKATDQLPLPEAQVKIISFASPDEVIISNSDGIAEFTLQEGTPYVAIGSRDGYIGMHTGMAEKGADKSSVIHPIVTTTNAGKLPVVGFVINNNKSAIRQAQVKIINTTTTQIVPVNVDNGVFSFFSEKGNEYKIEVVANGYETQQKSLAVDKQATDVPILEVQLPTTELNNDSVTVQPHQLIAGIVKNKQGDLLYDANVLVNDKITGEKIPAQFKNGILSFEGIKGKTYSILVDHQDYLPASQDITIPKTAIPEKISITLEEKPFEIIKHTLAVKIFKETDHTPLANAQLKIISFTETDLEITANDEGIGEFSLVEGMPYVIIGSKDGYIGMHTGIADKANDKSSVIHPLAARAESENGLPIVGRITNKRGDLIDKVTVTVIEKSSGKEIPVQFRSGILTFYGEKGKSYTIAVDHKDYLPTSEEIVIPEQVSNAEKILITMNARKQLTESYRMAVQVIKATDQLPLPEAQVKIISFASPDEVIISNSEGVAEFTLLEGTPYVAIGSRDGYIGMHTGMVEKGTDKSSVIHPIITTTNAGKLPVVGFVIDDHKSAIQQAQVKIINTTTTQVMQVNVDNGVFSFFSEKGNEYRIEIVADGYETQQKTLGIAKEATDVPILEVQLTSSKKTPVSGSMIILNNDSDAVIFYITSTDSHNEITEQEGILYLQNALDTTAFGKGNLTQLLEDPNDFIHNYNLEVNQVSVKHIYFDFNEAILDEGDKVELNKLVAILQQYPSLHLTIGAHADDRGNDTYNLKLSKKRAKSAASYLASLGVKASRITTEAYGESIPLVTCLTAACTEEQYQKNRRVEFILNVEKETTNKPYSITQPKRENKLTYDQLVAQYGDKQTEGLLFKVSIGAYRFNSTLTFDNLKDLGEVESIQVNGITYYYLKGFATLNAVENIRKEVVERGISDAITAIYYNDKRISFSTFIALKN
jgi:outer membrane protein OmpA-like peptidoglycan-associated protein